MSQKIILTDDQYAVLVTAAEARKQTPEDILAEWIEAVRVSHHASSSHVSSMHRARHVEDDPNATQPMANGLQGSATRH